MIGSIKALGRVIITALILGVMASIAVRTPEFRRIMNPIHYVEPITAHSHRCGVDPFLVASIIRVESRYRVTAVSSKGARGLMQIMPDTGAWAARALGLSGYSDEDLDDPEINIAIGTWYIAQLLGQFHGRVPVVLAAYNGGPANAEKWTSDGAWSGTSRDLSCIPFPETARYVARVLDAYDTYLYAYRGRWPGDNSGCIRQPRAGHSYSDGIWYNHSAMVMFEEVLK